MTTIKTLKAFAAAAAATTLLVGPVAAADNYPTRGVSWVIPFGAGGGTDRLSRLFVAESERIVGQTLTVENHAGAGGVTGWSHVLGQPADGYTIFNASPTPVITLLTEEEPPFDPTEIEIIAYIGAFASILVTRESDFPDWESFAAAAQERPITIGGTNATLLGVANTLSQAGIDVIYVSYSSTGEAVTDFLGGHIDATAATESTSATIVPENGVAILNTSSIPLSADMAEALGNPPMSRDFGFNGLASPRWVGMHPDTPEELLQAAAEMVGKIAMDPVVQESWEASGEPIVYLNREEASADYAALVEALRSAVKLLD